MGVCVKRIGRVYSYGDDATVIRRDCQRRGLDFPFNGMVFLNAREIMARHFGDAVAAMDSGMLPGALEFSPPGVSHHPVDDCRGVAEAFRILRRQGKF